MDSGDPCGQKRDEHLVIKSPAQEHFLNITLKDLFAYVGHKES